MLTREQLQQNIVSMEEQGADQAEIQAYLDSQGKEESPKAEVTHGGVSLQASGVGKKIQEKTSFLKDFSTGFVKSGIKTLQAPIKPITDLISGKETGIPEEQLEAKNTSEKAGEIVSEIAQIAIPTTRIGKLASEAMKLLKLTKGVKTTKIASEAVTAGGVVAAQQGEIDSEARDAAILTAIFPVGGAILKSKEGGSRLINSLIKPLQKDLSYGKDPGRAVAEEGIIANSLGEL